MMCKDEELQYEIQIGAYLDDEMTPEERSEFEAKLEQEPGVAELFETRKQQHELIIRIAESAESQIETPEAVTKLLSSEDANHKVQLPIRFWQNHKLGMAASLAAVAGFAFIFINQIIPNWSSSLFEEQLLSQALSGELNRFNDSESDAFLVNMSFVDQQNRLCREYFVKQASVTFHKVACFENGGWQLQIEGVAQNSPLDKTYKPAFNSDDSHISDYIDTQLTGDILTKQQERTAIENGWSADSSR